MPYRVGVQEGILPMDRIADQFGAGSRVVDSSISRPLEQGTLFPLKAIIEFPPRIITADTLGEVEAEDRHRYYIKGDKPGHVICASEAICGFLAEEVGITVPTSKVIEMIDGRLVFGSRRVSGVADEVATRLFLETASQPDTNPEMVSLRKILSEIYAFDLAMNNVDRHLGNYVSVEDQAGRRLLAIDHSRALFFRWPFNGFPSSLENTIVTGRALRQLHDFDLAAALSVADKLGRLAPAVIEGFISRLPPSWLPPELGRQLMAWWSNGGRVKRLMELDAGLRSGELL